MTLTNSLKLDQISDMELQNIREIVNSHQVMISKFNEYSSKCQDPQIQQMFSQSAQSAQQTVNILIQSL
ncbi:hypothetical protein GOQ27_12315 [Clostridium sp. D2Q-11]|uniref:Uncharacterized protein n=1 Tax=Anaeromonas frigoriresistens TaxID=2683708 RepID=A0A942UZQ1_9FIRM|nr:hypothetical protein [Anaeromonas frigoriresistens]MBS4539251.1 hypothetical protein [Anaeromonas frigoriresistens]